VYFFTSYALSIFDQTIDWEDYTLMISFMSKGFHYKDQIKELFIVMVCIVMYVFPTRFIVNFLSNFTFKLQHTFQMHDIAYLC